MSNSKPAAQLPTEQAAVTTDKPSTTTGEPKEQDHAVHATSQQQNANDQEDIFSPLRESMFCFFLKVISNYFETLGVMCFLEECRCSLRIIYVTEHYVNEIMYDPGCCFA